MKYTLLIILGGLILMWSVAAVRMTTPAEQTHPVLSESMYQQIQPGMSPEDVQEIIGCKPTEVLSSASSEGAMLHYTWESRRKSAIRAKFVAGKLISTTRTDKLN